MAHPMDQLQHATKGDQNEDTTKNDSKCKELHHVLRGHQRTYGKGMQRHVGDIPEVK